MPDSQPTKSDLEEEFELLRDSVEEYPALRPIVENLPEEVPDPQRASGSQSDQPENLVVTPSGDLAHEGHSHADHEHEVAAVPAGAPRMEFRDRGGLQLGRWRLSLPEKRQALRARQEIFQDRARGLNVQLKQGRIEPDAWFRQMRGEIRKLHTSAYGIGYSGKFDEMGLQDYGAIGNTVQRQYRFLQKWKTQIRTEGLEAFSLAQLNDRAQKYGAASRESFEKGYGSEVGIDTSVLPAHPGDGSTICMTRCKCRWSIDILSKENGDFNCTWTLGDAEHCVAGGVMVHTAKGSHTVRRAYNEGIKEIHTGDALQRTNGVVMSGKKSCVTVKTTFGYELTCTVDHELRYWDPTDQQIKWGAVEDVEQLINDGLSPKVVMKRGYNWKPRVSPCFDLQEFMGYMDGNGHVTELSRTYSDGTPKRQVGYTIPKRYESILDRYQQAVSQVFGFTFNVTEHSESDEVWHVRSGHRKIGQWAASEKLKQGQVPPRIRSATPGRQASYLRGLFDADGHVDQRGMIVTLSSAERRFIREIQDLLFGLGILSKFRKSTRGTNYKEDRVLYTLRLLGGPNLQRFIDRVGFGCGEKREKLNEPERDYTTGDTYPLGWKRRKSFPTLQRNINQAVEDASSPKTRQRYKKIQRWVKKELFFAEIDEIQSVGEREVYDVTDSPTNAFLANGFVVHNCDTCLRRAMEWVQLEVRANQLRSDPEPIFA